jgi:hypothetical protein
MTCRATVAQRRPVPSDAGACVRVEMREVHGLAVYFVRADLRRELRTRLARVTRWD